MSDEVSCCGACGHPLHTTKSADRIEALTAKLAKAVEGLGKAAALIEDRHVVHMTSKGRDPKDYISNWSLIAKEVRALLAEIEGSDAP
jgi:transcription initiation factor IIE alpha subunit